MRSNDTFKLREFDDTRLRQVVSSKTIRSIISPISIAAAALLSTGCGGDKDADLFVPSQDAGDAGDAHDAMINDAQDASETLDGGQEADALQDAPSDTAQDTKLDTTIDTGTGETPITKAEIAMSLTEDVMGYIQNPTCDPIYTDIPTDRLCNSTNIIAIRTGATGGSFNPSSTLTRTELAKFVSETVGFLNDPSACQNIPQNQIEGTYFGAFCRHNIPITSPGQGFEPTDMVGADEWKNEFLPALEDYFAAPSTRLSVSENAYKVILGQNWNPNSTCASNYADVANNSPECAITNRLITVGALDAGDANFNGQGNADWATTMKVYVEAAKPYLNPNLYTSICTPGSTELSCSGAYRDSFACDDAEALCDKGFIDPSSMTGTIITNIPSRQQSSHLAYDIQISRDKP